MSSHKASPSNFASPQIRAVYNTTTIRVYQAYSDTIADSALQNGTFVSPPFKMTRMTWIKPSFLWMMYRSGWGLKESNQKRILAIDISRTGFEWALNHSCLSHASESISKEQWVGEKNAAPVRIQWDPERDLFLAPLHIRTIQVGLSNDAVSLYVNEWIQHITDVTPLAHTIHSLIENNEIDLAKQMLPVEIPYFPSKY